MLRMHSLGNTAALDEREQAFSEWFDIDVDPSTSLISIMETLGTNLERIVGAEQASRAFAGLNNCKNDWRESFQHTIFYLETELGMKLTSMTAYAMFGLFDGDEAKLHGLLNTVEALLLDCEKERWLPEWEKEPLLPTIAMARARWNLDHGHGLEPEGLALLGGVKLSRIRNMMSGTSPELPKDPTGLLSNEASRAWLEKRECYLPTIFRSQEADCALTEENVDPVFVPVARDGSMFLPSHQRNGLFQIGDKGNEEQVSSYDEALRKLQAMPIARWRRANAEGNWGIVSAIEWRRVDRRSL